MGAHVIISSTVIIVDPTADLQAAVDGTPAGGVLRLGVGTFTAPTGGLLITRGITIEGSGRNVTIIQAYSVASGQPVIRFAKSTDPEYVDEINSVVLRDLAVYGGGQVMDNAPGSYPYAGSYGIDLDLATNQLVRHVALERLYIHHCANAGLYATGDGGATAVIGLSVRECVINENWGDGAYVQGATLVRFDSNLFASNYGRGCCFESCSPTVTGDYYENNCHSALLTLGYDGQLRCYSGVVSLHGLVFEDFNNDGSGGESAYMQQQATKVGLALQSVTGRVDACRFYNSASIGSTDERGIFIDQSSYLNALEIGPCMFDGCYIAISANATSGPSNLTRQLSISPQNQHTYEALILQNPGTSLVAATTAEMAAMHYGAGGQVIFNKNDMVPKVWTADSWATVVAGPVSYEDEMVSYEDEPVTY